MCFLGLRKVSTVRWQKPIGQPSEFFQNLYAIHPSQPIPYWPFLTLELKVVLFIVDGTARPFAGEEGQIMTKFAKLCTDCDTDKIVHN